MPRLASLLVPLALVAAPIFAPLPARAQTSAARPAQEVYREATTLIEQKQWSEARSLLLDLWASKQTHDVAASLGQVEYQLGDYPASATYLAFAVQNLPPREKAELEARYRLAFDTVKKKVATVQITVTPPSAEISIDAVKVERGAQGEVYLRPGNHSVEAAYEGRSNLQSIVAAAGQTHQIELTVPEAGQQSPAAPSPTPSPAPGSTEPRSRSMVPAYVAGGIALVGLGLGIGFELAAQSDDDDIERLHDRVPSGGCASAIPAPECSDLEDAAGSFDTHRTIAVTGFVVAGVGAATAIGYLLWPEDKPPAGSWRRLRLGAAADQSGAAIFARGSF